MKANPFKDALTIKDVISQAKDAGFKPQVGDSQSEKADPKKDPPQEKAQIQDFLWWFSMYNLL